MYAKIQPKSPYKRAPVGLRQTILHIQENEREQLRKENLQRINLQTINEDDQLEVTTENFTE